jgi:hypothetical protein
MSKTAMSLVAALVLARVASAQPEPVALLLVTEEGPRPELAGALRIQLTGLTALREVPEPAPGATLPERIRAAAALGERERALAVLWTEGPIEHADGSRESIVYVVGRSQGRALVEVVRAPGGPDPDLDRTLALKVRELLEALLAARTQSPEPGLLEPVPEVGEPAAGAAKEPSAVQARLEVGAVAGAQAGSTLGQWGGAVAGGPSLIGQHLRASALVELAFYPALGLQRSGSRVRLQALAPALALRADVRAGPLWLGPRLSAALSFVSAQGRDTAAAEGERDVSLLVLATGAGIELPLPPSFACFGALELELRPQRQRFTVRGREVADLGHVRPVVRLGLAFTP